MAEVKKVKVPESQPKIEIPDPQLQIKQFEYFVAEKISSIEKAFSFHNNVVIAIFLLGFVVIVFTVIGLVFQAWQFATAYQKESIQLRIQEELITNTVRQQKLLIESQEVIKKDIGEIKDSLSQ